MDEEILLMEQYLNGELDEISRRGFEERLSTDNSFAGRFAVYKTLYEQEKFAVLHHEEEKQFTALTKKISAAYQPKTSAKKWYYLAASAAAVLLVCIALFQFIRPVSMDKLYSEYAVHDDIPATLRGPEDTLLLKAATLFNKKDYQAALPEIRHYLEAHPQDELMTLSSGICLLETGQTDEAMKLFEKISAGSLVFKNKALWYQALVFLKKHDKNKCREILLQIPQNSGNDNNARQLLKALD